MTKSIAKTKLVGATTTLNVKPKMVVADTLCPFCSNVFRSLDFVIFPLP
jgi:hypothetical protein